MPGMASATTKSAQEGGGLKSLLIAVVVTCLAGLGVGFGVGAVLIPVSQADIEKPGTEQNASPNGESATANEAKAELAGAGEADPLDLGILPLTPIITNLAGNSSVWIRMEGSIAYLKSGTKTPEQLSAESAQAILNYLRTINLTDLSQAGGLQFILDDLNMTLRSLSGGQVRNVLISGLVVE
jgi:flagellar protein FliL